jgi:hypothetical protein
MILYTWLIKDFKVKFNQFLCLFNLATWEFLSDYKIFKISVICEDLNKDIYAF